MWELQLPFLIGLNGGNSGGISGDDKTGMINRRYVWFAEIFLFAFRLRYKQPKLYCVIEFAGFSLPWDHSTGTPHRYTPRQHPTGISSC